VIKSLNYYASGKIPILLHLVDNPIFDLYAPPELETEVLEYINQRDAKKEILLAGWNTLKNALKIKSVQNNKARKLAIDAIGKKDLDDVPFVELYFALNAHGIITDDKHYEDPTIKKFDIPKLGKVVGTYHMGMTSFFIAYDLMPQVIDFLFKIIGFIVKELARYLEMLITLIAAALTGAVNNIATAISNAPQWLQALLLGALAAGVIVMVFSEKTRDKVTSAAKIFWSKIKPLLVQIVNWLKSVINYLLERIKKLGPYAISSASVLAEINKHIEEFKNEIRNIILDESLTKQ
jgi:predicted nucleic acid-binding protein